MIKIDCYFVGVPFQSFRSSGGIELAVTVITIAVAVITLKNDSSNNMNGI